MAATAQSVRDWGRQAGRDGVACKDRGLSSPGRDELTTLRRENHRLRQDRDILAEAAAQFAREGEGSRRPRLEGALRRVLDVSLMHSVSRWLLTVLVAIALVGGVGTQRLYPVAAGMPCGMTMMPAAVSGAHAKPTPCKGMTADCIKRLCCGADTALPLSRAGDLTGVRISTTRYWSLHARVTAWILSPDPWPPRPI